MNQVQKQARRGRRRRVPAFGEWNYYYSGELSTPAPAAAEWYAPALEPEACSDAWFKYSPPPRKPPRRKTARRPAPEVDGEPGGGKRSAPHASTPARVASDVSSSPKAARTLAKPVTAREVRRRSVDADLYQVPPPEFEPDAPRPRRKQTSRSAWMACLGFSCCVA